MGGVVVVMEAVFGGSDFLGGGGGGGGGGCSHCHSEGNKSWAKAQRLGGSWGKAGWKLGKGWEEAGGVETGLWSESSLVPRPARRFRLHESGARAWERGYSQQVTKSWAGPENEASLRGDMYWQ